MAKSRDQYGEVSIHPMGRRFKLGQLYDVCHDRIAAEKRMNSSSFSTNKIKEQHHPNCMPDEIFDKLDINPKIRLELLLGINNLSGGMAAFVKNVHEKDFSSGTNYLHTYIYKSKQVDPSRLLRDKSHKKIPENATHVVQEITYGCNTIIRMDDELPKEPEKDMPTFFFENLPNITLSHETCNANICFDAKALTSVTCKMYSDVNPITPCNNLHQALQHLKYVQKRTVPVRVTLVPIAEANVYRDVNPTNNLQALPLQHLKDIQKHNLPIKPFKATLGPIIEPKVYKEVGDKLAKDALCILSNLKATEKRCMHLLNDPKREKCEIIQDKVNTFYKLITEHRNKVASELEKLIRSISKLRQNYSDMQAFLNDTEKSPFNPNLSAKWLATKEQELAKIEETKKKFPNVSFVSTSLHKPSNTTSSDGKYSFYFVIQLPKEDKLLQMMSEYHAGQGDGAPQQHLSETNVTTAFDDICKTYQEILQRLKDGKENTCLVLEEADVPFLSGSIKFLDSDFTLPRQPTVFKVEEVTSTSFQLSWMTSDQKPKYESHEIIVSSEDCERKYKSKVDHLKIGKLDPRTEFIVTIFSLYGPIRSEPSQEIRITTLPSEKLPLSEVDESLEITSKQSQTKQQKSDVLEKRLVTAIKGDKAEADTSTFPNKAQADGGNGERSSRSELSRTSRRKRLRDELRIENSKKQSKCITEPDENSLMYLSNMEKVGGNKKIQTFGRSLHSNLRDTFEKKMSQDELRIKKLKEQSTCITEPGENPKVYLLNMKKVGGNKRIQKLEFGTKKRDVPEKVVLLLGSTGSGKTTLINGMANFILGIKWDDDFRIKLVSEKEEDCDQTQSQTKQITSYTIHPQKGSRIPFSLTLVDTPGFEDTGGLKRDQEIMKQIKEFFTASGDLSLNHVDGIGLVVLSSLARLTPIQMYIFDSILSLFGHDVAQNIFPLLTFADGQEPQVLDALETAEIPHDLYYTFNNSALYAGGSKNTEFNKMFWEKGEENFGMFLNSLSEAEAKSLKTTKEVLYERGKLESQIEGIRQDIEVGLHKMEELECELAAIQQHEEEIERNKDFTYITTEMNTLRKPLDHDQLAMNCSSCRYTCHTSNSDTYVSQKLRTGSCSSCPQGCTWTSHKLLPYKYHRVWKEVTRSSCDLQKKYEYAMDEKLKHEQILQTIASDIRQTKVNLTEKVLQVKKCITCLQKIALKPSSPSTVEYVEQMIDEEKLTGDSGWDKRVKQLEGVKETAQFVDSMIEDGFDPFRDFSKTLEKVKQHLK